MGIKLVGIYTKLTLGQLQITRITNELEVFTKQIDPEESPNVGAIYTVMMEVVKDTVKVCVLELLREKMEGAVLTGISIATV